MFVGINIEGEKVNIIDLNEKPKDKFYCPACKSELITKWGKIKVPHFAHSNGEDCDAWPHKEMTEWHRNWQNEFPEECREYVLQHEDKLHRADILYKYFVIEFQHSYISRDEFVARNKFYNQLNLKVIGVFDMISFEKYPGNPYKSGFGYSFDGDGKVMFKELNLESIEMYNGRWLRAKGTFRNGFPSKDVYVIFQMSDKNTSFNHKYDKSNFSVNYFQTIVNTSWELAYDEPRLDSFTTTSALGTIEKLKEFIDKYDNKKDIYTIKGVVTGIPLNGDYVTCNKINKGTNKYNGHLIEKIDIDGYSKKYKKSENDFIGKIITEPVNGITQNDNFMKKDMIVISINHSLSTYKAAKIITGIAPDGSKIIMIDKYNTYKEKMLGDEFVGMLI